MWLVSGIVCYCSHRKFADIGKICQKQFNNEHYHLKLGWADLVTVHGLPGPGVLKALREVD